MKAVFLLAIVLVIAAAVVNAEEDHKKNHDRNHGHKDHKEHKDRNHGKNRNKKEHRGHAEKHEGKNDRHHKDRKHTDVKHADRSANSRVVHYREAENTCPTNKEAWCLRSICIVTCAEADNTIRRIQCGYEKWIQIVLKNLIPGASSDEECKPDHENYKCICKAGFFLKEDDDNCVKKEECSSETKPEGEGDGEGGEDDKDVHYRVAENTCPTNKEPCCIKNRCIVTCADAHNTIRKIQCAYEKWLQIILMYFIPGASGDEECKPDHENYKCVCKATFFWKEIDDSCVKQEECSSETKLDGEGDGKGGKDGEDGDVV